MFILVIIPILPNKLNSLIDAPVPFIIGFTSKPTSIPPDVIVFDLEEKTLKLVGQYPFKLKNLLVFRSVTGFAKIQGIVSFWLKFR
jgi:hypothetical protein